MFTRAERVGAGWADVVTSISGVREGLEAAVTGCWMSVVADASADDGAGPTLTGRPNQNSPWSG